MIINNNNKTVSNSIITNILFANNKYIEANGLMMNITHNSGKNRLEEQVSNSIK